MKWLGAFLIIFSASVVASDIVMTTEQPAPNRVNSGISLIRGWAISPTEAVTSVTVTIDDHSPMVMPYGDARGLVGQWYDGWPNSYNCGWSQAVDWNNYRPGTHTIEIEACTATGCKVNVQTFDTVKFRVPFGSSVSIGDVATDGQRIFLTGVNVEGVLSNVELEWLPQAHQWNIISVNEPDTGLPDEDQQFLMLINNLRQEVGAPPLGWDVALALASTLHSQDMANNSYFSHTGLNGSQFSARAIDAGFQGFAMGENIAAGSASASATFNQWLNSPPHYANMTNSSAAKVGYGSGYASGSQWGYYHTMIIGR